MKYTDYYKYLTENNSNDITYVKVLIARALKRFPDADSQEVFSYCSSNLNGVTIKKLEDDAKLHKWNEDTIKAIYYVTSRKKLNRPKGN
jgi:hypothetical protein